MAGLGMGAIERVLDRLETKLPELAALHAHALATWRDARHGAARSWKRTVVQYGEGLKIRPDLIETAPKADLTRMLREALAEVLLPLAMQAHRQGFGKVTLEELCDAD